MLKIILKHKNKLLLCAILLYALQIFTYRLDKNPPGFFVDESVYGYEAYHILTNKGHSSNGEFLPRIFKNPGQPYRSHSIFTYFVIPNIVLFGVNEFSVRITSVFFSLLNMFLLYKLLKDKLRYFNILLLLAIWPITAWVFLVSRIGMELIYTSFAYLLAIYIFDKYHSKKQTLRSTLLITFVILHLFWSYAPGKVFGIAFFVFYTIYSYFLTKNKKNWLFNSSIASSFFIFLTVLPSIKYLQDKTFFYRANELFSCQSIAACFKDNILTHFQWKNYFVNNYMPPDFQVVTHSIIGSSLLPRFTIPFIILGIISLVLSFYRNKHRYFIVLITFAFLIGTVPASLTIRGFDSYRSVVLLPIIFIVLAYGISLLEYILAKLPKILYLSSLLLLLIALAYYSIEQLKVYHQYEYRTEAAGYSAWQYGYRQIYNYFTKHYFEYDSFYVTPQIAYLPDIYIRFFDYKNQHPNIKVGLPPTNSEYQNNLYAIRPGEVNLTDFTIIKTINYPNNRDAAFYLIRRY